jgi:hypothetical protein
MGRVQSGYYSRLDVLAQTGLVRVVILGHVSRASAAGGDDGVLEGGRLEVGRVDLGGPGGVGHVAGSAAAVGSELGGHDGVCL